jgi:hypothetical protein
MIRIVPYFPSLYVRTYIDKLCTLFLYVLVISYVIDIAASVEYSSFNFHPGACFPDLSIQIRTSKIVRAWISNTNCTSVLK